jgi:hypothetical protein
MSNDAQKLKIELVKEVDQFGNILYSIEKNGFYLSGSVTGGGNVKDSDEKRQELYQVALDKYNAFIKTAVYEKTREVMQNIEI